MLSNIVVRKFKQPTNAFPALLPATLSRQDLRKQLTRLLLPLTWHTGIKNICVVKGSFQQRLFCIIIESCKQKTDLSNWQTPTVSKLQQSTTAVKDSHLQISANQVREKWWQHLDNSATTQPLSGIVVEWLYLLLCCQALPVWPHHRLPASLLYHRRLLQNTGECQQ